MVRVDLPGMEQKDIDVQLKDNILTIKGERKTEKEEKDQEHRVYEISYGCFQRSIALSEEILAEEVKASYKNGVLNIEIPKDKSKAPKQISVKVE